MQEDNHLQAAPIFTALTRPPMMMGITLDFLGIAAMLAMCIFIGLGNPLYLLSYVPLHLIGWFACRVDPNLFRVWFKALDCLPVANKPYWGCQSYDPS